LPFLHFCKKYDICTFNGGVWSCALGKLSQFFTRSIVIGYSQFLKV